MKKNKLLKVFGSLALLFAMLFTMISCGNKKDDDTVNTVDTQEIVGEKTLAFSKEDNEGAEVNILYPLWGHYDEFFFREELDGTLMGDAIYKRTKLVEDYLGIKLVSESTNSIKDIATLLRTNSMSGDDSYQIVLTHMYESLTAVVSEECALNLYDVEYLSFDEDYWNMEAIEAVEVQSNAYIAMNDYMLSDPETIMFNKTMADEYKIENLYDTVRNGKWTLEKMFEVASQVSGGTGDATGTYGFTCLADWPLWAFIDSCDINVITSVDGYKKLDMSSKNERYLGLFETMMDSFKEDYTYYYRKDGDVLNITSGQTLLSVERVGDAYQYMSSDVKFGFLPYPKYDEDQAEYRSYDWSGFLCIPSAVQNVELTAKTVECLAFFSEETVCEAYYEYLLGLRVSEAPDDAEMLKLIFDNTVSNVIFNYRRTSDGLCYLSEAIHAGIKAQLEGKNYDSISYLWGTYGRQAQKGLDAVLN